MLAMPVLAILILIVIVKMARLVYNRRKSHNNVAGEQISKQDKTLCAILAVLLPLVFLFLFLTLGDFIVAHDLQPPSMTWTFAGIVVEAFAIVAAFRLVRLARTQIWIDGITAFLIHSLFLGIIILFYLEAAISFW